MHCHCPFVVNGGIHPDRPGPTWVGERMAMKPRLPSARSIWTEVPLASMTVLETWWNGVMTGTRSKHATRVNHVTPHMRRIMAGIKHCGAQGIPATEQTWESRSEVLWSRTFGMKPSASVVRNQRRTNHRARDWPAGRMCETAGRYMLQEIEVVQNQKDGQKDIDNHPGQHYNVKQFGVASHVFFHVFFSCGKWTFCWVSYPEEMCQASSVSTLNICASNKYQRKKNGTIWSSSY